MTNLLLLIPVALILGGLGLVAFMWALKSGQFDDLDGAAYRILFDDPADKPQTPPDSTGDIASASQQGPKDQHSKD